MSPTSPPFRFRCVGSTRQHLQRAFSLVELLVVIAIIAILAGLAFPIIGKISRQGKIASTSSEMRQIGQAIHTYAGENNGFMPGPCVIAVYNYGRYTPADKDVPHLGAYLARYLGASPDDNAKDPKKYPLEALMCPALPIEAQKDPRTANYRLIDPGRQTGTNELNVFGSHPGTAFSGVNAASVTQPKNLGGIPENARHMPILGTADQQTWVSADNGLLPEKGVFDGKRLYLYLDGSLNLSEKGEYIKR